MKLNTGAGSVLVIGAAAMVSLAACGSSSSGNGEAKKNGPQVATDAANALKAAGAFHLAGNITDSGKKESLDLQIQGSDSSGTLTVSGQSVNLLTVGGKTYVKANTAFWTGNGVSATAAAKIDGRWVTLPASDATDFQEFTAAGLANELQHPTSGGAIQNSVQTSTVNGKKVVVLKQQDGSVLDIAATGAAYPVQISNKGTTAGTLDFSGYGQRQTISAPASPLDLSSGG